MNKEFFIEKCMEWFDKELRPAQWAGYREKLSRFTDDQLSKLYSAVIDNCKYFPKLPELNELAGTLFRQETRPLHSWKPTDCGLCGGSGYTAIFWTQEFEIGESGKTQVLQLSRAMPYHQSGSRCREAPDEVRSVYRCQCMSGDVSTIDKGIPRWTQERPTTMRRAWL